MQQAYLKLLELPGQIWKPKNIWFCQFEQFQQVGNLGRFCFLCFNFQVLLYLTLANLNMYSMMKVQCKRENLVQILQYQTRAVTKIDYCNAMWCVCWDPMDYEVIIKLCMILIFSFMFLHALRCVLLLWPSNYVCLQDGVFMLDSGFMPPFVPGHEWHKLLRARVCSFY